MSSVNKVILLGRLTRDPETRYTGDGKAVVNFSIATSETWKDKSGAKQEKTEFSNCVAFGKLAEIITQYLKKGSQVYVEGKLNTEKYQGKDGSDRYATKIIVDEMTMLGGKQENAQAGAPEPAQAKQKPDIGGSNWDDMDSDIPFAPHGKCGAGVSWRML